MEVGLLKLFELGKYLSEKRNTVFEWGQHDCNTLVIEWHDRMFGTNWLAEVRGQYDSRMGAIRFLRDKISAVEWLEAAGYTKVDNPKSGDILSDGFAAYIVFDIYAYTVHEHGTLTKIPLDGLEAQAWRHKEWVQ